MQPPHSTLVCFAVKEEAESFERLAADWSHVLTLVTGMGQDNAGRAVRAALANERPGLVLTCGFAGGLRPGLTTGTVIFTEDGEAGLEASLLAAGARPGRFHCTDRVATTAREKQLLWETTGRDAVEMESQAIMNLCRSSQIPCATVRVILDAASQDLPLDFNALMTAGQQLNPCKLALALARTPGKIGALLRLRKQSQVAALRLTETLATALRSREKPEH